jgi:hypothetical protein
VQCAQDDLQGARSSYERSLQLRQELGEKGGIANSQVSLAAVALENGRATEAASLASQAAHEFQSEKDADQQAAAENMLAQALIAQGKYSDATAVMAVAQTLQVHDLLTTVSLDLTAAKLHAKTGKLLEARRELQQTENRAAEKGLIGLASQAQLALAEADIASGKLSQARADLQSIDRLAAPRGYRLLARKASELEASLRNAPRTPGR